MMESQKIVTLLENILRRLERLEALENNKMQEQQEMNDLHKKNSVILFENQEIAKQFNHHVWMLEAMGKLMKKALPPSWVHGSALRDEV